jgi:hypothetical protein
VVEVDGGVGQSAQCFVGVDDNGHTLGHQGFVGRLHEDLAGRPHPHDSRARLLELSDRGRGARTVLAAGPV